MKKLLRKILPKSLIFHLRNLKANLIWHKKNLAVKTKIMLGMPLKKKLSKIRFEMHLAEHCNLNCKSCSDFSPIAPHEFVDTDELRRDFERLGELFNHECDRIFLMGGEPLLHPELCEIMKFSRKNFTHGDILVFTNGILLSQQKPEFWQTCHDCNITVNISAYPININIEKIRETAKKFDVNVQWAWNASQEGLQDIFIVPAINLKGDSNALVNWGVCVRANQCVVLSHGRLFTCSFAPHVHHFNKKFGKNVEITEADYLNIYDSWTADEIFQKLSEPILACRYCTYDKPPRRFKWGHSEGKIEEWI